MWLYIAFLQVFLPISTTFTVGNMCISKGNVTDYKTCNKQQINEIIRNANTLNDHNTCMDIMWRIVHVDPFWSFSNLTHTTGISNVESYPSDHSAIGHALKASCWPTISHYLYEYKKNYSVTVGDKTIKEPLYMDNIRDLSCNRLNGIIKQCEGTAAVPSSVEVCKKIGLYLVLDILHPELLGRPSWFLTLLDPNAAQVKLKFLRDTLDGIDGTNLNDNNYLKMYNAFVDRIVPNETGKFSVVVDCSSATTIADKSLCYIQSIRTVFDLGANVDIQHYHIHDMVTGKKLSALKTNYSICDENKNASVNNLCGNSYSTYMNSLNSVSYPDMSNAKLSTKKDILTYMRGRANYEFWQKLKSIK